MGPRARCRSENDEQDEGPHDPVGDDLDRRDVAEKGEVEREDAPDAVGDQAEKDAYPALGLGQSLPDAQDTVQVSVPLSRA